MVHTKISLVSGKQRKEQLIGYCREHPKEVLTALKGRYRIYSYGYIDFPFGMDYADHGLKIEYVEDNNQDAEMTRKLQSLRIPGSELKIRGKKPPFLLPADIVSSCEILIGIATRPDEELADLFRGRKHLVPGHTRDLLDFYEVAKCYRASTVEEILEREKPEKTH